MQKAYHDREAKPLPPLKQGEMVRIYDQKKLMCGEKATVKEKIAPRSYIVETKHKVQYKRNRKQLRKIWKSKTEMIKLQAQRNERRNKSRRRRLLDYPRMKYTMKKPRRNTLNR